MAGFDNDVMYANNVDFTGSATVSATVLNNGELLIGAGAAPNIRVGNLTSIGGSITITNGPGTINLEAGGGTPLTFVENVGVAVPAANILNVLGLNGISTSGAGNTITITSTNGQIATAFNVDANTPPGTDPVVPNASGVVTITGAQVAAGVVGANVIRTDSLAANTYTIEIQRSTAVAGSASVNNGVSHFDSADFTVDANGFVQASGTGIGQTITGDAGGPLSPTAGNWNIFGRSGSKTSGAVSTLTINSPPYSNQGSSTSVTLNSGSFATAAITLTTPVTAGLLDGDLLEFVATNGVLVIQLAATQVAHIGTLSTSVAGTMTSTLTGDSVSLRYQASTNDWWATSVIGTWVMA